MADEGTITELVARIRSGDARAAAELVRRYEPLVRREVRLRLRDRRLGRVLESMDVCQSVMASFFVRTAAGQYDLERPDQVLGLLVTMARNKVASAARHQGRARRDVRRSAAGGDAALAGVAAPGPSPSAVVAGRDLLDRFLGGLSPDERRLVELRDQGLAWSDVAARVGGTAQARRMQLARAVDRVCRALGIDGEDAHA
jgi:RNA polymerase sigma-70 factor (ECF subfamily)